jgi:uncharacterized protein YjbI with pentapeptide repeats
LPHLDKEELEDMADKKHLKILKQGLQQWNQWRIANEDIKPNLKGVDLKEADLKGADFHETDLSGADLRGADLHAADLVAANLSGANLSDAFLFSTNLTSANLSKATMFGTNLTNAHLVGSNLQGALMYDADLESANLTGADLTGADLSCADLVETDFTSAVITGCRVYGVSAWNVILLDTLQQDLIVSKADEPIVTVDDLEVAQFIYLMLNNTKIRNVINTITSKGVLILGRFSDPERKAVLDGLREKLREFDLLPMVFDFDRPTDKDYTETVQTLAGLCMFAIADLTSPKSTPLELEATVKQFKIPYIPILNVSVDPRAFSMLADLQKSFHWVLPTLEYESKEELLDDENLKTYIIDRANAKLEELRKAKSREPEKIVIRKKSVTTAPA